jgi:hypothetical protein
MIRFVEAALFVYALWLDIGIGIHIARFTQSTLAGTVAQVNAAAGPQH